MKKRMICLLAFAAMMSTPVFTACDDDDNALQTPPVEHPSSEENLSGVITGHKTLDAAVRYYISGSVVVADGGVLEIPAGMTLRARKGFANYILVAQGGKIVAEGTASQPIVFTADVDNATPGYWGGIIINGRAPISGASASGNVGATEINNDYKYGGDDVSDNSGVLRYVEICYSGARSSAEIEHNGLTLNGVGNSTVVENIYIMEGADDGVEFFGGSVNVKNLLVVNCEDDMFDFTQGYNGTLSNCYGVWEKNFTSDESDPRGVEADGNLDGDGPDHAGQSDFKIENMTIENNSASAEMQDVIKVRRGAKVAISNAVVMGSGRVIDLVDFTDKKGAGDDASTVVLTNRLAEPLTGKEVNGEGRVELTDANKGVDRSLFSWCSYKFK